MLIALAACGASASWAQAYVFWSTGDGIGRANNDGSGVDPTFITGLNPTSVLVADDGTYIYWTNYDQATGTWAIGRANLDGTGVKPGFLTGIAGTPIAFAVGGGHVYWTLNDSANNTSTIVRDGTPLITEQPQNFDDALAVGSNHIYWAGNGVIQRANIDGSNVQTIASINAEAGGLAVDNAHIYFTAASLDYPEGYVGSANLDGSGLQAIVATNSPQGVATDGTEIYWGTAYGLYRANSDGSGAQQIDPTDISDVTSLAADGVGPGGGGGGGCSGPAGGFASWTGNPLKATVGPLPLPSAGYLQVDDSVTPSAKFTSTLQPPSVIPLLPHSVKVHTSAGDVQLDLLAGSTTGLPAALCAQPPFPQLVDLAPPSAKDLANAIHPRNGWFSVPLGTGSRSMTLTLTSFNPLFFSTTLDDVFSASFRIEQWRLYALAGAAAITVIVATLPEDAVAAAAALGAEGIGAAAGVISRLISSVIIPVLERAPGALVTVIKSIPGSLAGAASAVYAAAHPLPSIAGTASASQTTAPLASQTTAPLTTRARVLPLRKGDLRALRAELLIGGLAKAARAALLSLPVSTVVRPVVVSRRPPRGRGAVVVLGGRLPGTTAQLVITGPGYGAVRDVRIVRGLAGGRIVLPLGRRPGRWYAGIVDYSGLHVRAGHLSGHAILEAASWIVNRQPLR
jgi:hypothetical protein